MQKWEYLFVTWEEGSARYVNGSELPVGKKNTLMAWANQRGEEGWELVNESMQYSHRYLVFKRPKA